MRDDPPERHPRPARPPRRPQRKKLAPLTGFKPAPAAATPKSDSAAAGAQRIAKVIARAGACSRRDAEAWIGEGRVALNGVVLTSPAVNVTETDEIAIDGAPLAARAKTRLFLFHKTRGLVTTERDPEGRETIFDHLRTHWPDAPRLVSVGRLDINTEGLLLLTNDGGLARVLELPSTGWMRRYRVRAKGVTDQAALDQLRQGVTIEGVAYAEIEATLDRVQGANCWLTMGLREGKNREIKRVLEHLGLEVNRLIRLSFGPFQLGEIAEGAMEEVKTRVLREQLGPALAQAAGVDFAGPAEGAESPAPAATRTRPPRDGAPGRGQPAREARPPKRADMPAREARTEARGRPVPAPRKHVLALRAAVAGQEGGRKRTLRGETADRSGRTVPVERLVRAGPSRRAADAKPDAHRNSIENNGIVDRHSERRPSTRNSRRFAAERQGGDDAVTARPHSRAPGKKPIAASPAGGRPRDGAKGPGHRRFKKNNDEGRAARPRGPYDPAKDRSKLAPRRQGGTPDSGDRPFRRTKAAAGRSEAGAADEKRGKDAFGARPAKPRGPKPVGASPKSRNKNNGPRDKTGRKGGGPGKGRPRGKP